MARGAPLAAGLVALLVAAGCAQRVPPPETVPRTAEATTPAPAEPVAPLPAPEPLPAAPEPVPPAAPEVEVPLLVRIGLASDLERVELPCCGEHLVLEAGAESVPLTAPVVVTPEAGVGGGYRIQVAALRDDEQAGQLARSLEDHHHLPSDVHFDAGTGLFRVRSGLFALREDAEAARTRLAAAGIAGTWVVSEAAAGAPGLVLTRQGRVLRVAGRWLRVRNVGRGGLGAQGGRYRGDLLVFLNPRGALNLINELPVEEYLRGVVPKEMGPAQFPRLEALKAQAVAARTYTLAHLGGFRAEGYDLCATPRCQVYGGMVAEHPLSDRAIAETESQVLLHGGELVDARYSATCGGHTEDAAVVFPGEDLPYLKGIPCVEAGTTVLEGVALEGAPFVAPMALAGDGGPPVRSEAAYFLAVERGPGGDRLRLHRAPRQWTVPLPPHLETYRRRNGGHYATDLALVPGDPLTLWFEGERLLAVVQEVEPHQVAFERRGPYDHWRRFRSDRDIAGRLERQYPGLGFTHLEVLDHGRSGRVKAVRFHGRGGRAEVVAGLPVRWMLDVPDTRFTVERTRGPRGETGYAFAGSGWGHGVGMCQVGSYGMAGRGLEYREILEHYYSGVELARV
ncbi:MAG TPA: SpoIID/LytB domain-containing protein, partial [Thermoanaerobaculia bacterium]|nr:SpoIID/LytB domain-containing protein [Thermoanaerobaculia bacterium]